MDRRDALRIANLHYIKAFIEADDPNGMLRTYVDNWFAYKQGGSFLTNSLRARWFNRKDFQTKPQAVLNFHYHSERAWSVFHDDAPWENLVKDHTIPIRILKQRLFNLEAKSIEAIENILIESYRIALITEEEHRNLANIGLAYDLPANAQNSHLSRYEEARIEMRSSQLNMTIEN